MKNERLTEFLDGSLVEMVQKNVFIGEFRSEFNFDCISFFFLSLFFHISRFLSPQFHAVPPFFFLSSLFLLSTFNDSVTVLLNLTN